MNIFNEYIRKYMAACFVTAFIYAFSVDNQSILYSIIDACIYGSILGISGIIYWNTLQFIIPRFLQSGYQLGVAFILALFSGTLIVGIETFVMYIWAPDYIIRFTTTIPVRIFISFLIFIGIRLYFELYHSKRKIDKNKTGDETFPIGQTVNRITVRSGQKIKIISLEEIIYIKADGDYIAIHTSEGNWLKEQTMKYTEEILPPDRFVRIHRSYIVNTNYISRIERYGDQQQIVLHNHEKIKISAARYQTLKQLLGI